MGNNDEDNPEPTWTANIAYLQGQIDGLMVRIKSIEQQLIDLLNVGPTITQKKMWLDELIESTKEDIARRLAMKVGDLFGRESKNKALKDSIERAKKLK